MKGKFVELESIIDFAISEIKNNNISPEDGEKILIGLYEDYRKLGNTPPEFDSIKKVIEKYVKK
ncbi:hypothetical protein BWK59_14280 [Flavobacterium davisii]|uniref:Uncharacterized protein n=1 Tax=Flavobacterium davisii TaxID=2906077 RepID=A0A246GF36_9FLAO|nr:hypothetical protein [Flavobacterium davisii]OWP82733.1 hypothetical protein BWK59_14280 [Flavobacterium davisii]